MDKFNLMENLMRLWIESSLNYKTVISGVFLVSNRLNQHPLHLHPSWFRLVLFLSSTHEHER